MTLSDQIAAGNAGPEAVEAATDAYETERARWRIIPDMTSQWNT